MKLGCAAVLILCLTQGVVAQKSGVVSDTVSCKKATDQTYALYLPKTYSSSSPVGLILFFDPGARGKMPVDLYKGLADKYSLILACSNNSRNGSVDASLGSGYAVLEDVISRFNVDKNFILVSGFSGGARTAVELAVRHRKINPLRSAGIIACGAALPSQDAITLETQVPFAEVIGQLDMNYQEALRAREYLKLIHNPALLTFFYGGHQWPPVDAYEEALAWHLKRVDVRQILRQAQILIDSGYLFEASRSLRQRLGAKPIDSLFSIVQKDKRTRPQSKEAEKMDALEVQKQQQFYYAFTRHLAYAAPDSAYHPQFWNSFRKDCEKMIAGDRYRKLVGLRLIDYGWRLCAEQHFFLMGQEQYRQAAMTARIWALMQPMNPAPCVQAAKAFALQERKPETLDYLREAVARGLKDKKAVMADPAFAGYSKIEEFQKIFQ